MYVYNPTTATTPHPHPIQGLTTMRVGTEIWATPVAGIGQGNRAGLQIWAVVSTPILNLLRQEGYGVTFKASISGDKIHFMGYSFVDNTDLIQTGPIIPTSETDTLLLM